MIFAISHLGDHVLYWNFDTLDNLTTMERSEQVNYDPRVEDRTGQVEMGVSVAENICAAKQPFLCDFLCFLSHEQPKNLVFKLTSGLGCLTKIAG